MNAGKKLFILLFSLGLAYGASAQRGGFHGGGGVVVVGRGGYYGGGWGYPYGGIGLGLGFGYPWGYPYGPYAYPPYYYGYGAMPNQLELQVRDIRNDYDAQIKDVRHDKALSRKERRTKIDQLKTDRDNAIVQARHDYFYNSRRNYNNQQPKSGNNGSSSNDGPEYQEQGANTTGSK